MTETYNEMVFSSYGLFIVGIIAILHDKTIIGSCMCVSAVASVLYWGKPSDVTLMIDKFFAVFSAIVINLYFISFTTGFVVTTLGWISLFTTAILYYTSVRLHSTDNEQWKTMHVLFHLTSIVSGFFIVVS